jgi:hypothetical protein
MHETNIYLVKQMNAYKIYSTLYLLYNGLATQLIIASLSNIRKRSENKYKKLIVILIAPETSVI